MNKPFSSAGGFALPVVISTKGIFVPYGFLMAPIGATLVVLLPVFDSFSSLDDRLIVVAASGLVWGFGVVEGFVAFLMFGKARAPSVRATRRVMEVGLVLLIAQFAFLVVPDTVGRVFSTQTPFSQVFEWIGYGTILVASYSLGGAAWNVWNRWSQSGSDELEIPYWARPSLQEWMFLGGIASGTAGYFIDTRLPALALGLYSLGGILLLVGILPRKRSEAELSRASESSPEKVELRKVTYEEKLALAKRACELILHKYGRRRVFAVVLWGDETENSQSYSGLHLLVVVRDGIRIPLQRYLYQGLEINIAYWPEMGILYRAKTLDEEWPWRSDSYRRRIVLYENKGWFRKLDAAVQSSERVDPTDAIRESALLLLGHLAKLQDYQLQNDLVGQKEECWRIAWGAIELVFLLNHRYIMQDYWKEVFECPIQTSDLRHQLEILLEVTHTSIDVMVEAARILSGELFEMVSSRGINMVSSELRV